MRLAAILSGPLLALTAVGFAQAAEISVVPPEQGRPTVVLVKGTFDREDGDEFARKVAALTEAIVVFNSDGGNVIAGVMIGEEINNRKLSTLVPNNARCASACAIAWLGGTKRFMGPESRIGFHAAYDSKTGQESGAANAVIGAFLNKIGLPYSTIAYITQAAPTSMTWLRLDEAIARGIQVTLLEAPAVKPKVSESGRENGSPTDDPQNHSTPE